MGVISGTTAAIIGATALAGVGAGVALQPKEKKAPTPIATPNAPTPETAEQKAKDALLKKRKIQQRTGGKTILASKYGGAVDTKSLLGE